MWKDVKKLSEHLISKLEFNKKKKEGLAANFAVLIYNSLGIPAPEPIPLNILKQVLMLTIKNARLR